MAVSAFSRWMASQTVNEEFPTDSIGNLDAYRQLSAIASFIGLTTLASLPVVNPIVQSDLDHYFPKVPGDIPSACRGLDSFGQPFVYVRYFDEEEMTLHAEIIYHPYLFGINQFNRITCIGLFNGRVLSQESEIIDLNTLTLGGSSACWEYLGRLVRGEPCGSRSPGFSKKEMDLFKIQGAVESEGSRFLTDGRSVVHLDNV